ncbi:MAG: hypothetical protein ACLPKB_22930 [Xanthobacteraceae bacterium]
MFRKLANPSSRHTQSARLGQNSLKLAGAAVFAALGAGLIVGLPAVSSDSASASVRESAQAAGIMDGALIDAAACDRHSWPYLDQRCVDPAATGKDLRQVRVISTDRIAPTTIVTTATPLARVVPQNSGPRVAAAAPPTSQTTLTQTNWTANPVLLALLPQGAPAKEPMHKTTSQTKAPSQAARVAMVVQVRH